MTEAKIAAKRPVPVTLAGWWMGVYGAPLSLYYLMTLLGSYSALDPLPENSPSSLLLGVSFAVSVCIFVTGFGLLRMRGWAYGATLVTQVLNIIVVALNVSPLIPSDQPFARLIVLLAGLVVLISLGIITYLWFGKGRSVLRPA